MTLKLTRIGFIAASLIAASCSLAAAGAPLTTEELAQMKLALESRYPEVKILDVKPSPIPGLYEIFTGEDIAYADSAGNYLFVGRIVDTRTHRDLTLERIDARNSIDFEKLPFERAIKITKGNGSRKLAVFTDPDCPSCQQLEKELTALSDVTIYTFLYPVAKLHPQAPAKARAIWCAKNPSRAWADWMLEKKTPSEATCERDPIDELQALGKKLYINATPMLFLPNGNRLRGSRTAPQLEELLSNSREPAVSPGSKTSDVGG